VASLPPELLALHRGLNRESALSWERFAEHRARVTALAVEPGGVRCTVLGAGNCNDLDLEALAARYAEVELVDVDGEALARARDRQRPETAARLVLRAPIDVSGVLGRLERFRRRALTPAELGALPQQCVQAALAGLTPGADVVVSAGLLSQIVHTCDRALGAQHEQLQIVACALVIAHLRVLAQLVRPGGTIVLVTDTVSSETYALEELWGERTPLALLDHLEETENFLSGTSPAFLRRTLRTDLVLGPLVEPPRLVEPWLWRLSDRLTLLAYALVFKRR
jgi:hypothetical protein